MILLFLRPVASFPTKVASWFQSAVLWNFSLCIPFCQGPWWQSNLGKNDLSQRPSALVPSESERATFCCSQPSSDLRSFNLRRAAAFSRWPSSPSKHEKWKCRPCLFSATTFQILSSLADYHANAIGTSLAQSIVIVKQISSMWNGVPNYSISACKNDSPPEILIWQCFRVVVVNEPTIDQHTYIAVPFSCY